ncbi:MAG: hypothetical protein ABI234_07955 [Ktedonobacteraceae bacterium]
MSLRPFTDCLSLLARYLKPQRSSTLLMVLLLLASIGLQLLNPLILRSFIDTIAVHGVSMVLIMAALLYLGVSLLNKGVSVIANYLSEKVAWTATNWLRADLLAHILTLAMKLTSCKLFVYQEHEGI